MLISIVVGLESGRRFLRPFQERLDANPDLPSDAKSIVRVKLDVRESADESARVAQVQALNDELYIR